MRVIFHLVIESEWLALARGGEYLPARFEQDGFIHCTGDLGSTLEVAASYFSEVHEPVLVLELELARISSRVVFEAPIPIPSGGRGHLAEGRLYPHIYGPLNVDAVVSRTVLAKKGDRFSL
jgi:uncharacterized protein (DUF952 family)